ncbi:hypothetical protein ACIPZC_04040 [Pseudomonas sp. NPDC089743]|uniref:hypothetical protein n=1 Tax=Pseudomonas sp. NPDC089743 TaxID=3364471 RepID=UPI00381DA03F
MSDFQAKLQHLSAEQVEALYSEYISGEKIAHLLERYAIDVAPSSLIKAFPPLPCAALRCPYCKTSLFERRKSRTASSCHDNMAFCKTCDHRHYFPGHTKWRRVCACQPCLAARQQARLELQAQQRQRIREHWSLARRQPIPLRSLSITRKLQLLALLEVRMDKQHERLLPAEHPTGEELVSPSKAMDASLLQALQEDLILLVDPDSPPASFSNDPTPKAWRDKVYWVVNVSLHGHQRAGLKPLRRALLDLLGAGPRPEWREQLSEAITALSIEHVCACIASRCAAHGLPFEPREKATQAAAQLLGMLPVASALSLVDDAVHSALTYIARSHVTPHHASSTIPANMLAGAERAVREQWQFGPCSYASSAYSRVLFDVLLRQDDHGLRRRIAEYIEELPRRGA